MLSYSYNITYVVYTHTFIYNIYLYELYESTCCLLWLRGLLLQNFVGRPYRIFCGSRADTTKYVGRI